MKKYWLIMIIMTVFSSFESFGQVYERIYATAPVEVQERMNQNKMSGVDILSNIQAHHTIGISGITVSQKSSLENLLSGDSMIISSTVNNEVTSVVIDSKGWFTKEKFEALIQQLNGAVTGYSATYSIVE